MRRVAILRINFRLVYFAESLVLFIFEIDGRLYHALQVVCLHWFAGVFDVGSQVMMHWHFIFGGGGFSGQTSAAKVIENCVVAEGGQDDNDTDDDEALFETLLAFIF